MEWVIATVVGWYVVAWFSVRRVQIHEGRPSDEMFWWWVLSPLPPLCIAVVVDLIVAAGKWCGRRLFPAALVAILAAAGGAAAAPIPAAALTPPESVVGAWRIRYGTAAGSVTFESGGRYTALMDSGQVWVGAWDRDPDGTVRLVEWTFYPGSDCAPAGPARYTFRPTGGDRRTVRYDSGGTAVELSR